MSSSVGYTKGPWNYRPDPDDDWGVVKAANGWHVAKVKGGDYKTQAQLDVYRDNGTDPYEANARLAAAAPELLEALKELISEGAFPTTSFEKAKAAIAKAEAK